MFGNHSPATQTNHADSLELYEQPLIYYINIYINQMDVYLMILYALAICNLHFTMPITLFESEYEREREGKMKRVRGRKKKRVRENI